MMRGMANTPAPTMLERLLDSIVDQLSPDAAEVFTNLYAPDDVKARLDALAEKILNEGLDQAERDEYDGLMQIVTAVSMIQERINARYGVQSPPVADSGTYIESVDLGTPIIPMPSPSRPAAQFEGLEALLEDLDENMRPRTRG
jgi:hypothetical protein